VSELQFDVAGVTAAPGIRVTPAWMKRASGLARAVLAGTMGKVGAASVGLMLILAVSAGIIAPYDPIAIAPMDRLEAPSLSHPLGTDQLGRDLLSRVIEGTRTVMEVVVAGIGGALVIGLGMGLVAGYGPRLLASLLMLLSDVVMSLPMMLFALAMTAMLGGGLGTVILVVIAFMVPAYFRVARGQTLTLKGADYIVAARAMGASPLRIITRHLLPNMAGPLLVLIAMDVPTVIGIESGLSFLGQGAQPPTPTWGSILRDGFAFIRQAPHIVLAGGLPILIATVGFTFFSEALRDALDPRLVGKKAGAK
jgi:peptide/nickel transport system permease protein